MAKTVFFAETAVIIGDVVMGDNCSVWYNAVLRGDVHYIRIGDHANIQDGAIIHCTYKVAPVNIGSWVSIAHNAIVHGCTIHDHVLIGMGAIILDGAVIESNSIIAAGAVVSKKYNRKIRIGICRNSGRKIKDIDTNLSEGEIKRIAENYSLYASWYKK